MASLLAAVVFSGLFTAPPLRAQNVGAEPNIVLFTVMAAINAAGYDAGMERPELAPVRVAVRQELARKNIPSLAAIKEFYQAHRQPDPVRDLSQYISLALLLDGPPKFELELSPVNLPPDVVDLQDFAPLLGAFYEQADIPALWRKHLPEMEQEAERYQQLLARIIRQSSAYLRIDTSDYLGRSFGVLLNPLSAPNQTDARNYGDNYFIVAGPSQTPPEEAILHGWLFYMLDPLAFKYPNILQSKAELLKLTQRAPALDPQMRSNFSLLVTQSLVAAVQARMSNDTERRRKAINDAMEEGLLLTAYFYEALGEFEKQPVGMRLYYPEMVDAIDVKKEQNRLSEVRFRPAAEQPRREVVWNPVEQGTRQAEQQIAHGQYDEARRNLEALMQVYGAHPQVVYDLALVASQQKQPELAKRYFQQAAATSSNPRTRAWAHIYLGRLLDLEENRDAALAEYTAALNAGDASAETRAAAEQGLKQPFAPPAGAAGDQGEPARERVPLGRTPTGAQSPSEP